MKEDIKNNINLIDYRPDLDYDKKYDTDGVFSDLNNNKDTDKKKPTKDKHKVISNLKDRLDKLIPIIPEHVIDTYIPPYLGMQDEFDRVTGTDEGGGGITPEITDPDKDKDKDKEPTGPDTGGVTDPDKDKDKDKVPTIPPYIVEEEEEDDDSFVPDIFDLGDTEFVEIKAEKPNWQEIILEGYEIDFLDIYEDYLTKMIITCESYIYDLFNLVDVGNNTVIDDDFKTDDLKNKNLKHLVDYNHKSSVSLNLNLRLHKKMYSIDETIVHIRSIRLAKEFATRYNVSEPLEKLTNLEIRSNALLEESRMVAEKKYEENFYNLYKYLNSSVILLGDTLNILKKQAVSHSILSKNGEGTKV